MSQMSDFELLLEANAIKNQTVRGANTAPVIGQMFVDIINNKLNIFPALEDINYDNIVQLKADSRLVAGKQYIISDYQTVHTIPNTSSTNYGAVERLVVTAISRTELSPIAYSLDHPKDIIYYSLENNASVVAGSLYGYIYRRIDTVQNNDIPFDFRNVKFRRWQINVTTQDATGAVGNYSAGQLVLKTSTTSIYLKLNNKTSVPFTNTSCWRILSFDNLSYISPTSTNWEIAQGYFVSTLPCTSLHQDYNMWSNSSFYNSSFNNKIEAPNGNIIIYNNSVIFYSNFYNNKIGGNFYNNSISYDFHENSIGAYCYNNLFGQYINKNSFGDYCYNNIFCDSVEGNNIKYNFYNNLIAGQFVDNTIDSSFIANSICIGFNANAIGQYCTRNIIGFSAYKNYMGNSFTENVIGDDFISNNIDSFFSFNTILDGFRQNQVCALMQSRDFSLATFVYQSYSCTLFVGSTGYPMLNYFLGTTLKTEIAIQ